MLFVIRYSLLGKNQGITFNITYTFYELIDDLITSIDEGFINKEDYELGRTKISNAMALLNGYINYLNRKVNPQ